MSREPTPEAGDRREHRRQLQSLRSKLAAERAAWSRRTPRLKRAFHAIERLDQRIARLERQISKIDKS